MFGKRWIPATATIIAKRTVRTTCDEMVSI